MVSMTPDEAAYMAHQLDDAAARLIAVGAPWPAYRGLLNQADKLMDIALA